MQTPRLLRIAQLFCASIAFLHDGPLVVIGRCLVGKNGGDAHCLEAEDAVGSCSGEQEDELQQRVAGDELRQQRRAAERTAPALLSPPPTLLQREPPRAHENDNLPSDNGSDNLPSAAGGAIHVPFPLELLARMLLLNVWFANLPKRASLDMSAPLDMSATQSCFRDATDAEGAVSCLRVHEKNSINNNEVFTKFQGSAPQCFHADDSESVDNKVACLQGKVDEVRSEQEKGKVRKQLESWLSEMPELPRELRESLKIPEGLTKLREVLKTENVNKFLADPHSILFAQSSMSPEKQRTAVLAFATFLIWITHRGNGLHCLHGFVLGVAVVLVRTTTGNTSPPEEFPATLVALHVANEIAHSAPLQENLELVWGLVGPFVQLYVLVARALLELITAVLGNIPATGALKLLFVFLRRLCDILARDADYQRAGTGRQPLLANRREEPKPMVSWLITSVARLLFLGTATMMFLGWLAHSQATFYSQLPATPWRIEPDLFAGQGMSFTWQNEDPFFTSLREDADNHNAARENELWSSILNGIPGGETLQEAFKILPTRNTQVDKRKLDEIVAEIKKLATNYREKGADIYRDLPVLDKLEEELTRSRGLSGDAVELFVRNANSGFLPDGYEDLVSLLEDFPNLRHYRGCRGTEITKQLDEEFPKMLEDCKKALELADSKGKNAVDTEAGMRTLVHEKLDSLVVSFDHAGTADAAGAGEGEQSSASTSQEKKINELVHEIDEFVKTRDVLAGDIGETQGVYEGELAKAAKQARDIVRLADHEHDRQMGSQEGEKLQQKAQDTTGLLLSPGGGGGLLSGGGSSSLQAVGNFIGGALMSLTGKQDRKKDESERYRQQAMAERSLKGETRAGRKDPLSGTSSASTFAKSIEDQDPFLARELNDITGRVHEALRKKKEDPQLLMAVENIEAKMLRNVICASRASRRSHASQDESVANESDSVSPGADEAVAFFAEEMLASISSNSKLIEFCQPPASGTLILPQFEEFLETQYSMDFWLDRGLLDLAKRIMSTDATGKQQQQVKAQQKRHLRAIGKAVKNVRESRRKFWKKKMGVIVWKNALNRLRIVLEGVLMRPKFCKAIIEPLHNYTKSMSDTVERSGQAAKETLTDFLVVFSEFLGDKLR